MNQKKVNKKQIGGIIGSIIGAAVVALIFQLDVFSPSFDKVLMDTASSLNENCPIMVDKETRLDNVMGLPDNVFQYNYTLVNWNIDSIDIIEFEKSIQPQILNNVKTNPDLATFRDNRTTLDYNYRDKNGVFVTRISITPADYED
jgi:hypothetical protein